MLGLVWSYINRPSCRHHHELSSVQLTVHNPFQFVINGPPESVRLFSEVVVVVVVAATRPTKQQQPRNVLLLGNSYTRIPELTISHPR